MVNLQQLRELFTQQQWHSLLQQLNQLPLAQLNEPELWFLHARSLQALGIPELSYPSFLSAIQLDPEAAGLRLQLLRALQDDRQWKQSLELIGQGGWGELSASTELYLCKLRAEVHLGSIDQVEAELMQLQQEHDDVDLAELGIALVELNLQRDDFELAHHCLGRLLELDPNWPASLVARANVIAAQWTPACVEPLMQLSQTHQNCRLLQVQIVDHLKRQKQFDAAEAVLRSAIEIHGLSGHLASALLSLLVIQGRIDDLRHWLAKKPWLADTTDPELVEAECLMNAGQLDQAQAILQAHEPTADVISRRIDCLRRQCRYEEAASESQALVIKSPDVADYQLQYSYQLLSLGRWLEAWPHYEKRLQSSFAADLLPACFQPRNDHRHPSGLDVVVIAEQGFGDTVMMASMLSDLQAVANKVTFLVQPRLQPLMGHSFPLITVQSSISPEEFASKDACYCIGSLGQFFRSSPAACPGSPFLLPPQEDVDRWRHQLEQLGPGLRVGIAWRGGGDQAEHRRRSLALEQLSDLLRLPGIQWINLQYRHSPEELQDAADLTGASLHHFEDITVDLSATAALTKALDLVITVQQTALHFAGAVGTPAWVLVPVAPEWRYGVEGSQMAWYSNVELFRQPCFGDWTTPISQVQQRLLALLAEHQRPE